MAVIIWLVIIYITITFVDADCKGQMTRIQWPGLVNDVKYCIIPCLKLEEADTVHGGFTPPQMTCVGGIVYACIDKHIMPENKEILHTRRPRIKTKIPVKSLQIADSAQNHRNIYILPIDGQCHGNSGDAEKWDDIKDKVSLYLELKSMLTQIEYYWNYAEKGDETGKALKVPKSTKSGPSLMRFALKSDINKLEGVSRAILWEEWKYPKQFGPLLTKQYPYISDRNKKFDPKRLGKTEYVILRQKTKLPIVDWGVFDMKELYLNHQQRYTPLKLRQMEFAQYKAEPCNGDDKRCHISCDCKAHICVNGDKKFYQKFQHSGKQWTECKIRVKPKPYVLESKDWNSGSYTLPQPIPLNEKSETSTQHDLAQPASANPVSVSKSSTEHDFARAGYVDYLYDENLDPDVYRKVGPKSNGYNALEVMVSVGLVLICCCICAGITCLIGSIGGYSGYIISNKFMNENEQESEV